VELWTLPAEELLQAGDVGLIPRVPLTDFADPPETTLQRRRESIEQHGPPGEKANLLTVTRRRNRIGRRRQTTEGPRAIGVKGRLKTGQWTLVEQELSQ